MSGQSGRDDLEAYGVPSNLTIYLNGTDLWWHNDWVCHVTIPTECLCSSSALGVILIWPIFSGHWNLDCYVNLDSRFSRFLAIPEQGLEIWQLKKVIKGVIMSEFKAQNKPCVIFLKIVI